MNIRFTPTAFADPDQIHAQIAAADRFVGRAGRISGTHELSVARLPYFVVYRLAAGAEIDVITIRPDGRRDPEH
ncbi:hypothetical protein [Rhizobium sp. HT1-10]|uniref:hypothetical protein n=1 Tax=Rhizobium sp. HT1-10 TaxID=3111638 RepID=UPI003C147075